jgi:hypothetical protein
VNARIRKSIITLILITILTQFFSSPAKAAEAALDTEEALVLAKVRAQVPHGQAMVANAIEVLSKGLEGMSEQELALFLTYYDPAGTGEADEVFVQDVLANYRKIEARLNEEITFIYVPNSSNCPLMTLYFTDFFRIYVCPYMVTEEHSERIARSMVHEVAHMALLVYDRAYFYESSAYKKLAPRSHEYTRLPLIGHLLREVLREDTLYHPDAYAHFAVALENMEAEALEEKDNDEDKPLVPSISPEMQKYAAN